MTYLTATRLVVNTVHRFVYPFLPAIARGLGISLADAGVLLSARSVAFVATPVVASTVGRGERRVRLIVFATALMAIGCLLTAATGMVAGAVVGFILLGLGKPSFDAAAQAYVADRTPYARRARMLSILELTWAGGMLIGAPVAGLLIDRLGWQSPFWVMFVLLGVATFAAPTLLESDGSHRRAASPRFRPTRQTMALLATAFCFSFAAENTFVVFGAWLEDEFMLSLAALGLASTVIAVAELIGEGSVLAFADRIGPRRMVAAALIVSAMGYATLGPVSDSIVWGLGVLAVSFIAFEISIVATVPLATEASPDARTRFLAWLMVAWGVSRAAGDVAGPLLYEWKGLVANTTVSALAVLVSLGLLLVLVEEPSQGMGTRDDLTSEL
jgi:predicted MFS family arabinose efflux permease